MKNKSRSAAALLTALSFSIISLSGCATQGRYDPKYPPERTRYQMQGQNLPGNPNRPLNYNNRIGLNVNPGNPRLGTTPRITTPRVGTGIGNNISTPGAPMTTDRVKADNIRSQLDNMPGIDKVNVMVLGNTALVAYGRPTAAGNVNTTEKIVANKVKQIDNSITNVYVTESADMGTKISRLYNDMVNNRPMSQVRDQFNRLVNSITPTGVMGK